MIGDQPLVSVVLPTHNGLPYLQRAVESVLVQTYQNWELILVDDGSTDGTLTFAVALADDRVVVEALRHCGIPGFVRNVGVQLARGPVIAFLDSDDVWKPHKLERQLRCMRAHRDCRWSYTGLERIDQRGNPLSPSDVTPWRPFAGWILEPLLSLAAIVATPTVMVESAFLRAVGGFDPRLRYCEDYDLWFRLAANSEVCVLDEPLSFVRSHAGSHTRDRRGVHASWQRVYARQMAELHDRRQRRLCSRRRSDHAAAYYRLCADAGHVAEAVRGVVAGLRHSWRHATWWRRSLGTLMTAGRELLRRPRQRLRR